MSDCLCKNYQTCIRKKSNYSPIEDHAYFILVATDIAVKGLESTLYRAVRLEPPRAEDETVPETSLVTEGKAAEPDTDRMKWHSSMYDRLGRGNAV